MTIGQEIIDNYTIEEIKQELVRYDGKYNKFFGYSIDYINMNVLEQNVKIYLKDDSGV